MRTFTSDVICENEYSLEDYQLSIQDTICSPSGTEKIKLEVCRERSDMRDTVSIDFYSYSPLEENVAVFAEEEIRFGPSQKCVQKIFFIQNNDVHILLNGDTSRKRPYTLKKTFFDGHEQMEYDYTNNYVFVSACENTVAADQTPKESVGLKLYPNPSTETIKVSVNTNQLATIQIYNSLGMEVYSAKTNGAKKSKIDISNLVDGLYILQVKLEDGREIAGKFMKLTL